MTLMKVFVCSRYSGDVEQNIKNAQKYGKYSLKAGVAPFIPHLYLPTLLDDNDLKERELGINVGLTFLKDCGQIWVFRSDGEVSSGMQKEIQFAKNNHISVIYIQDSVIKEIHEKY